jgi:hypothetical protein
MRANPISWIRRALAVALLSGVSCMAWASASPTGGSVTPHAVAHAVDASDAPAQATVAGTRVLPVRMDASDIEIRTLASNDFPPSSTSARDDRASPARAPASEGPDAWTAMLATLLLAAFFFVRRTF